MSGWSQSSPFPLFSAELDNHLARKAVSERARIGYQRAVIVQAAAEGSTSSHRAIMLPGSAIVEFIHDDERARPTPEELEELNYF